MNKTIAFTFANPAMCEKAAKGAPDLLAAWYAAVSRDEWQQAVLKDLKAAGDWAKKAPAAAAQLVAYIGGATEPTVPTVPGPTNPDSRPHVAGFLMQSKGLYSHTFFSAKTTDAERVQIINQHLANGFTTMYVYAANDNDYSGKSVRYSHADKERWVGGLTAIRNAGMSVIMWMRADDSPTLNKWTGEQVDAYNRQVVADLDELIDGYVIGLEVNEYWTADFTRDRVKALKGMTNKPAGVHTGSIDDIAYADSADVYYLQYGFNKSESEIASKTRAAIKRWNGAKPVIAAEYSMNSHTDAAKRLGDAAIMSGAVGVGNGCSDDGIALLSGGAVKTTTEPTPSQSADAIPASSINIVGKHKMDPAKASIVTTIKKASVESGEMRLSYSPSVNWDKQTGKNGKVTDGGMVLVWRDGSGYVGGFWDHHGVGQTVKTMANVREGYIGVKPAIGADTWMYLISYNGKERSSIAACGRWPG